jgi:hypothetical protein
MQSQKWGKGDGPAPRPLHCCTDIRILGLQHFNESSDERGPSLEQQTGDRYGSALM